MSSKDERESTEILKAELEGIAKSLKELVVWTKFAGMQQLRVILTQAIKTDSESLVFELSDGSRGTREVAELAGLGSNSTVASYWKRWSKQGIVVPTPGFEGRFQRICSLEEVGLAVPDLPKSSRVAANEKENQIV